MKHKGPYGVHKKQLKSVTIHDTGTAFFKRSNGSTNIHRGLSLRNIIRLVSQLQKLGYKDDQTYSNSDVRYKKAWPLGEYPKRLRNDKI